MIRPLRTLLLAAAWALASLPAMAADDTPANRQQLEQAKAAIEQRYKQAQADCSGRFQVTDCMSQARAERREALAPLQRQQLQWDDAKRRERAAERRQALQKRADDAAKSASAPGTARTTKTRRPAQADAAAAPSAAHPATPAASAPPAAASGAKASQAADKAREHREQAHKRLQQQQAHQQALEERNARQDAKHPPKPGLPVPASVVR